MKIAVASSGKEKDSKVSEMAGRAPYYLLFNEKGELEDTIKNPFAIGGGGAGWSVAHMLAEKGVKQVIAGRAGPNMEFALKQKKIKFKQTSGKVSDSLR